MPNANISDLNGGAVITALDGSELFECEKGGVNLPTNLNAIIAAAIGFALGIFVPASGDASGVTDLANMAAAATKVASGVTLYNGANWVNTSIRLSGSTYFLTGACPWMMASQLSHNTFGIKVQGMGAGATRIDYTPSVAGTPFLTNQWLLGSVFEDIAFVGHDATADFLASVEGTLGGGNIQDYVFSRCTWGGSWNNIFTLTGTNNNSEWKVHDCGVSGTLTGSWLNIPASGTSDQFLNFWFHNCKFNATTGSWVTMSLGGSVRVTAADTSGWSPVTPTYLFNLLGFAHARGVQSFSCDKLRMQMPTANCLFLHSQWAGGNISFDEVDQSSSAGIYPAGTDSMLIEIQNNPGPNMEFANSNFLGQHVYTYASNAFASQSRISYKSCDIIQYPNAASFVVFTELAGNKGGAPLVDFDINCRGNDASEIFATTLNWQFSTSGVTQSKTVNFQGANTTAPLSLGNIQRKLPPNAVLRSVNWNLGGTVGGAYGYAFQTIETTPTVLSTFAGANAATPANPVATALNFWMLTDAQRTVQLVETAGRSSTFGSYIATLTYDG